MYYTVYKITNQLNNKIYIGVHKTANVNDDYMGSGDHIKSSILKYGKEHFLKEILHVFDNADAMFNMESTLVNKDFLLREDVYNINLGGRCGFTEENVKAGRRATDKILEERWGDEWRTQLMKLARAGRTEESYKRAAKNAAATMLERYGHYGSMYGKTHTAASKQKMSNTKKNTGIGGNNSQYGSMWIHSIEVKQSKKINKDEAIPEGWLKGRKINFNAPTIVACGQCGEDICQREDVCKKKHVIKAFADYFNLDEKYIGTNKIYDEWDRVVELIKYEYHTNMLSTRELARKYKLPSSNRIDNIFKDIDIKPRTRIEGQRNYHNKYK